MLERHDDASFLELDDLWRGEGEQLRRPLPSVRLELPCALQDTQLQHLTPEVPLIQPLPQNHLIGALELG